MLEVTRLALAAFFIALAIPASGVAGPAPATAGATEADTLALRAPLRMTSTRGDFCPPGTDSDVECVRREGTGLVRGLGGVSESYVYMVDVTPAGCAAGMVKALGYPVRLTVAGKGTIELAVAESTCVAFATGPAATQPFTITGGSGTYAGVSGQGRVERAVSIGTGTDTWLGTLVVPGFDFDLVPPVLRGAVAKTVLAPRGALRARVTYRVTAVDAVDGVRPVTCRPRSGTLFRIGRTAVTCSATDTSANARSVRFVVTVRARR